MKIIGLTGGFKTGKSTVADILSKLGARVIDADRLARHTLEPKTKTLKRLVQTFGEGILDKRGKIDRPKLAKLVFGNRRNLQILNSIIHPQVIEDIKKQIAEIKNSNPEAIVIIEVPLLFEANMQDMMDKIIVVATTKDIQLKRARKTTSLSIEEIKKRINSQMPLSKKRKLADMVIDNNKNLEEIRRQVKKIWKKIKVK